MKNNDSSISLLTLINFGTTDSSSDGVYGDASGSCFWGSTGAVAASVVAAAAPNPASIGLAASAWGNALDACGAFDNNSSGNNTGDMSYGMSASDSGMVGGVYGGKR